MMNNDLPVAEACWRQALKLLQRRMHSRRELGMKLRQRGYPVAIIEVTLAEAERLSLVNDAAFAEAYQDELQRKGLGEMRVRAALHRRGVDRAAPDLPEDAAASDAARDDERTRARAAAVRKQAALAREPDPRKRREKLTRFLLARGFTLGTIREVLDGTGEAGEA
jgi:regulatory protein